MTVLVLKWLLLRLLCLPRVLLQVWLLIVSLAWRLSSSAFSVVEGARTMHAVARGMVAVAVVVFAVALVMVELDWFWLLFLLSLPWVCFVVAGALIRVVADVDAVAATLAMTAAARFCIVAVALVIAALAPVVLAVALVMAALALRLMLPCVLVLFWFQIRVLWVPLWFLVWSVMR